MVPVFFCIRTCKRVLCNGGEGFVLASLGVRRFGSQTSRGGPKRTENPRPRCLGLADFFASSPTQKRSFGVLNSDNFVRVRRLLPLASLKLRRTRFGRGLPRREGDFKRKGKPLPSLPRALVFFASGPAQKSTFGGFGYWIRCMGEKIAPSCFAKATQDKVRSRTSTAGG